MSKLIRQAFFPNKPIVWFSLILLLKSCVAGYVVFDKGLLWSLALTEIPFVLIVFSLIEWMATKRKILYYMFVNFLISMLYFAVLMYYKYYGVIATYHALSQVDKVAKVGESTYSLIAPYYLFIFIDIIIFMLFMFRPKYIAKWKKRGMKRINRVALSMIIGVSLGLCAFNIWPNSASMNEIKKAESMGFLNYEVYTLFADQADNELIDMTQITQKAINENKGITEPELPQYWGLNKDNNLIVVQMESFQKFLIGLTIEGQEITPNLNKLVKDNVYFSHFYTNAGQGTTSDAEFVVNTSFYVPDHEPATASAYMEKSLPSLPKLLQSNGYYTATFHTNSVDFWNREALYHAIGFDHYYDKTFFGEDDPIAFGASDEVLYARTLPELEQLDAADNPFYAMVISMSAHHPYRIPEAKYQMELPESYEDTLLGNYILAQNYADYALGQFLEGLKSSGLWDDSLIVFYGDHQGLPIYALEKKEKQLMEELIGHEYGYTDMLGVPFIVHAPGIDWSGELTRTGGQIDILPTVANLLGVSVDNQLHFGEDLMNQPLNLIPFKHFLPTGSFLNDSSLFVTGAGYDDGTNYSLLDNTITDGGSTERQFQAAEQLLRMSDSYLLQLE